MATDSSTQFFLSAPTQWIETGAARLICRRFGTGPALLLVHGFPLSGFTWRKLLPELSTHYTCYVPDLPGMGESEWSNQTDFSFPGQGRTLKALADGLGLTRYSVIAQNTGGTFARFLALKDPDRVERLVLINTEMPGHRPPWIPLYQFLLRLPATLSVFRRLLASRSFLRSPMGFGGCFTDLSLIEGEFHRQFVEPLLRSQRRMEGLQQYLIGARWGPVDALAHDHARLRMPVQLLWGEDDPTFPVAHVQAMLGQFPNAQLITIPGARLLVHEEKPQQVIQAVMAFLKSA
ncbi:MAG: alpha/beta fold hydrolase [Panacagrimonas sp.]